MQPFKLCFTFMSTVSVEFDAYIVKLQQDQKDRWSRSIRLSPKARFNSSSSAHFTRCLLTGTGGATTRLDWVWWQDRGMSLRSDLDNTD
jgi:hypothetical protein